MAAVASIAVLWLALAFLYQPVQASTTITVVPNCPEDQSCWDLDRGLDEMTDGMSLHLVSGSHQITRPHLGITDFSNISILGGDAEDTVISCADNTGLAFIGIENLIIRNLTIANCGLTGTNLSYYIMLLRETVDLWFLVPETAKIAVLMGNCVNVSIQDVTIRDTTGLGLLGINILGSSELTRVQFLRNVRPHCTDTDLILPSLINLETFYDQVGGGAYFLFSDYLNTSEPVDDAALSLNQNYYAFNADCTYAADVNLQYPFFTDDESQGLYEYAIGAGGGLSVILSSSLFGVTVEIVDTIFYGNDARYGAGAYVAVFAGFQHHLGAFFTNCSFLANGVTGLDPTLTKSYCKGGAGLAIFADLLKPRQFVSPILSPEDITTVKVRGSRFEGNQAKVQGGGVMAYSLFNTPHAVYDIKLPAYYTVKWFFVDTSFVNNSARFSSAASFRQLTSSGVTGTALLVFQDLNISNNAYQKPGEDPVLDGKASAVHLVSTACVIFGSITTISNNLGSALRVESTFVEVYEGASIVLRDNLAHRGGGAYLEGFEPIFYFHPSTRMEFTGNRAIAEGGAVFIRPETLPAETLDPIVYPSCFIGTTHFTKPTNPDGFFGLFNNTIEISFQGNQAPLGRMVFGSSLETCPWAYNIPRDIDGNLTLYQILHRDELFSSTFIFDEEPVGTDMVSTEPASLSVSLSREEEEEEGVVPGEVVGVDIEVLDQFGQEVFAIVTSEVQNGGDGRNGTDGVSFLGGSGFWYTGEEGATIRFHSLQNQTLNVSYFTSRDVVVTFLETRLLTCPAGFSYDNQSCLCDNDNVFTPSFSKAEVRCHDSSITVFTSPNYWFGTELDSINSTDLSDLIIHECHFDYCLVNSTFRPPDYDAQCREGSNRTGVLCGACRAGYSVVLGTSECRMCSNYYLFLIPVFGLAGILVFLAVAFLEFTIDKGWLNAALFYSNVVSLYSFAAFPQQSSLQLLLLPTHLLSLEVGYGVCLYDGMTAISRALIHFVFPVYLYLLMAVFGLLARRFSLSSYFSPAKTFVTVNLLSYLSLLSTCIGILGGGDVRNVRGESSFRWLIDANQLYFRGWHAPLGVLALIVLVGYLGTFTVLVLFPSLFYKLFKSGKPFFDAIYGPFKEEYRFWFGIRLIVRALLTAIARFAPTNISLVINLVLLVTMLQVQASIQPFKSKWLNWVDSYLIANAIILLVGLLNRIHLSELIRVGADIIYACIFLGVAYVVIGFIFGYYFDRRFPSIRLKLMKRLHPPPKPKKPVTSAEHAVEPPSSTSFCVNDRSMVMASRRGFRRPTSNLGDENYRESIFDFTSV